MACFVLFAYTHVAVPLGREKNFRTSTWIAVWLLACFHPFMH